MGKKSRYTFYQWCIDNDRDDLLNRWDYESTGFGPSDITYASAKPVYFKCPNGIHESEPRKVYVLTSKNASQKTFICKKCNEIVNHNFIDLTGMAFGELKVLCLDTTMVDKNDSYWICKCSCGCEKSIRGASLKNGAIVTCGNRSIHRLGENNSNWKGGITPVLLSKRTSSDYNTWRDAVYSKDWYTCQCCGASGSDIEKNAHHILNFAEYPDLEYDPNNGICLCSSCHHIKCIGSFHNVYGTRNNTSEQLEEYINNKRKQLGINIPFSIDNYRSGIILKPEMILRRNNNG